MLAKTLENEIVLAIDGLGLTKLRTSAYPDDPAQAFGKPFMQNMCFVAFTGMTRQGPANAWQKPFVTMDSYSFDVLLYGKSVRSHQGLYDLANAIDSALHGKVLQLQGMQASPLRVESFDYNSFLDKTFWNYRLTVKCEIVNKTLGRC